MPPESAKGTLLLGAVISVRRHRDKGRISAEMLEQKLSPETIALLDERIDVARWYPIENFSQLVTIEWEVAGHNDPLYLERQGAMTADRLFDSGLYQQLDFAERSGKVESRQSLQRQAKLITTITQTLYSFLTSEVRLEDGALQIEYGNAEKFIDALSHTTVGFMNQINLRQGSKRTWTTRRIAPDVVRFTMELPERLAD